jgi:hypothetical protein
MILHQEGQGRAVGAHAFSTDRGGSWRLAGDAYSWTVALAEGRGNVSFTRRERPQMLKEVDARTGFEVPRVMWSGVQDAGTGRTHTIAVPLNL